MIPHTAKVMFNDNVLHAEAHEDTLIPTEPVLLHLVDFPILFQDWTVTDALGEVLWEERKQLMTCGDPANLMHLQSILFDQNSSWLSWWFLLNLAHSTYTKVVKSSTSQLKLRNHQQFLLPNRLQRTKSHHKTLCQHKTLMTPVQWDTLKSLKIESWKTVLISSTWENSPYLISWGKQSLSHQFVTLGPLD